MHPIVGNEFQISTEFEIGSRAQMARKQAQAVVRVRDVLHMMHAHGCGAHRQCAVSKQQVLPSRGLVEVKLSIACGRRSGNRLLLRSTDYRVRTTEATLAGPPDVPGRTVLADPLQ